MLIWIVLLCLFIGYVLTSTLFVKVVSHKIHLDLPAPIKIVHLSDLHGRTTFLNGKLSKIVNSIDPDLVFITGDLVSRSKQLPKVLNELKRINTSKTFFVPGNYEREHSHGFKKRKLSNAEYLKNVETIGSLCRYLENSGEKMNLNGTKISIYGFDNSIYGLEEDNCNFKQNTKEVKILLAHSPSIIHYIDQHKLPYNLLLTGHTHGGQIRFFDKTFGAYKHFHLGMKKINSRSFFYINRGLGTVKLPIRINCYPEISVIRMD
ncbi:metallophosphoesterase [Chengkuizengella sediminis]|uniref:metallophosphoesterase n=1 Tax=Chengkuizengella sediminis TaxID=1885917 RepID=UPI001389EA91|nr:metallophosphoesterase [Chengkuizengella sediminis]NDI35463.1 hypothetical protein [Chengkuizengella sediminis]